MLPVRKLKLFLLLLLVVVVVVVGRVKKPGKPFEEATGRMSSELVKKCSDSLRVHYYYYYCHCRHY
jgi:hypothetical protein